MKAVFLDRDGVINENRPDYVKTWSEFTFLDGALEALRHLREAGWTVIVVTNQASINRKIVSQTTVDEIDCRMIQEISRAGGNVQAVLYCPHRPDENCDCRKPRPGLLTRAAEDFGLRLNECYLIGDALTDIVAGQAVGCRCILVQTGRGRQQLMSGQANPIAGYYVAADLRSAVQWMFDIEQARANVPTASTSSRLVATGGP